MSHLHTRKTRCWFSELTPKSQVTRITDTLLQSSAAAPRNRSERPRTSKGCRLLPNTKALISVTTPSHGGVQTSNDLRNQLYTNRGTRGRPRPTVTVTRQPNLTMSWDLVMHATGVTKAGKQQDPEGQRTGRRHEHEEITRGPVPRHPTESQSDHRTPLPMTKFSKRKAATTIRNTHTHPAEARALLCAQGP